MAVQNRRMPLDVNVKVYVSDLCKNPLFVSYLKQQVKPQMPPSKPWQAGASESEWAYNTGIRDGFKLAFTHLGVNIDDL